MGRVPNDSPRGKRPRRSPAPAGATGQDSAPRRFRNLDGYRAEREWNRYEGTAQRELFRSLRERFLDRHSVSNGWVLDVGSGPGRFTPRVGAPGCRRVAVDLSEAMLRALRGHWVGGLDQPRLARADAGQAPFRPGAFAEVAVLGNALGFAGTQALSLLEACADLVAPSGTLVVEVAPGIPTASRYLRRLPRSAMVRLLRAPVKAVLPRVVREGFAAAERPDRSRHGFRPIGELELTGRLGALGFTVLESSAVAVALGDDPERLEAVRADPVAWAHHLDLEEQLGHAPTRPSEPAALLVAAFRSAGPLAQGVN